MRDFESLSLESLRAKPGRKWQRYSPALASWIADMDFAPAPEITAALEAVTAAGDLGYPNWNDVRGDSPVAIAFAERMARRFAWHVDPSEVVDLNDVVQGIQAVLHVTTSPGDRVVVHTPAYPPFFSAVAGAGCELLAVPAERAGDRWAFDLDALDGRLEREPARVLLLCHPHNPTGRVFDRDELTRLAAIADRHDLLVISDEIHADLVHDPHGHVPFASLPGAQTRTITITSASKAFNLGGMHCAVAHVGAYSVAERLAALPDHLLGAPGIHAVAATVAAWREGDAWLTDVRAHLASMRDLAVELVRESLDGVEVLVPEATYLAWLDCRARFGDADPAERFAAAGVRLNPGPLFGPGGEGFARLNFATSSAILRQIVETMSTAR